LATILRTYPRNVLKIIAEGILKHLKAEDESWAGTKEPKAPKPKKQRVKKVSEERQRHLETLRTQIIEPREEAAKKERRGPDDLRRELDARRPEDFTDAEYIEALGENEGRNRWASKHRQQTTKPKPRDEVTGGGAMYLWDVKATVGTPPVIQQIGAGVARVNT
jgi:hypothetical protein